MATHVYSTGLCFASVCTDDPDDVAVRSANDEYPTGVTPWQIHGEPFADGTPNPTPCPDDPARRHILLSC